jgi:hypothetical protein
MGEIILLYAVQTEGAGTGNRDIAATIELGGYKSGAVEPEKNNAGIGTLRAFDGKILSHGPLWDYWLKRYRSTTRMPDGYRRLPSIQIGQQHHLHPYVLLSEDEQSIKFRVSDNSRATADQYIHSLTIPN